MERTKDIFDIIAERDATPPPKVYKRVKRWQIAYGGTARISSRFSRKLYTYHVARKIIKRAKRMGLDCYISPMMITIAS